MHQNEFKKSGNEKPLVSIITVNYNGRHYLAPFFESLRKLDYSPLEIILVDNASTDDSVQFTRGNYPEVRIVENEKNYMFARGNNEGIKIAQGEIICLINNDVEVDPAFLKPIVEAFSNDSRMAVCQPKVLDLNRKECFEYAGAAGGFIDRFGYPFMRGRVFFTLEEDQGQYNDEIDVFWASGACFCVRKSALKEVGLLDEDFILHMEEIDLCWRMRLAGWKIRCIPKARIWHKGGGTLSAENPRKLFWNYRNNIFLLVKNLSLFNLIKVLFYRAFLDLAALAGELLKGKGRSAYAIVQAYFWILTHPLLMRKKRQNVQQLRKLGDDDVFKLVYPGSIVWEYFGRRRKKFSELKRVYSILDSN